MSSHTSVVAVINEAGRGELIAPVRA
jgi:hypothetical protein